MFKKFKKKMILINMIIISSVLFISFTIIYSINYVNTYQEIYDKLESNKTIHPTSTSLPFSENMNNSISSFNLLVDGNSNILQVSSFYEFEDEFYEEILYEMNLSKNNYIKIEDNTWIFSTNKTTNADEQLITFINVTDDLNSLNYLLIGLIITYLCMLVLIYYLCVYFSNKYIKPIEENYIKQKQFIADASHELKTPIAIISANADAILLSKDETVKSQEKWINYIKDEAASMSKLINDLLSLAKSEEVKLNIKECNISKILTDLTITTETFAFEKNVKMVKHIDKNISLKTDSEKIRQLFLIFIDNAIKYSDEKNKIILSLKKEKKDIIFSVENKGTINKDDLNHIFERFYKCDKARTNTKSFGLGLAIGFNIINDLGYTIKVTNEKNIVKFIIKMK